MSLNYEVAVSGTQLGPFTREAVIAQFSKTAGAIYWTEGMEEWKPVGELVMAAKKAVLQAEHRERVAPVRAALAARRGEVLPEFEEARAEVDSRPAGAATMSKTGVPLVKVQRSYAIYAALWFFLGGFGVHEFYAGFAVRGFLWAFWTGGAGWAIVSGNHDVRVFGVIALGLEFTISFGVTMATSADADGDRMLGTSPEAPGR